METESRERYTKEEFHCLEKHIEKHFGKIGTVLHEIASPDIHVDIAVIEPAKKRLFFFNPRPYYTLLTMGMGARRMAVPETFREKKLERAELLITLPPGWKIGDADEQWHWPVRWLKFLARFPLNENTWLGWGHTVPNGEPFADNTKLSGMLLEMPWFFGADSQRCHLPGGGEVNFYQLVPLYDEEMEFKVRNGLDALAERFPDTFDMVVNITRENVCALRPDHGQGP
ncbi:MAG: suppressor of fused domain protein [Candidatus Accumulibacter sp.]|nr:suppressor of fused domain protein [Accumulibacter sp.]